VKTRPFFFVKITLVGGHVVSKAAKRFHAARHHVCREYAGNFMGPPFAPQLDNFDFVWIARQPCWQASEVVRVTSACSMVRRMV